MTVLRKLAVLGTITALVAVLWLASPMVWQSVAGASSSDATLSGLGLNGPNYAWLIIDPNTGTDSYSADVRNYVLTMTINPYLNHDQASYVIKLDGVTDSDGTVSLAVGSNVITVEVTAQDDTITETYTVTVTRTATLSMDATLSWLSLSWLSLSRIDFGAFSSGTLSYTAEVPNSVTETTVNASVNDFGASDVIKLGGVEDSDGTISLAVGSNIITIEVTAEDGETTRTYAVTVTRAPNTLATGSPTISGTAQVGETLTASTSGISDDDGLTSATFAYQWISNDGTADTDIHDATASTYTLADADVGKTIRVRVTFTDDVGNDESLTSTATVGSVQTGQSAPGRPTALRSRSTVPGEDKGIVLEWRAPQETVTGYQILRQEAPVTAAVLRGEPLPHGCTIETVVHVNDTGSDATTYADTDVAEGAGYTYRVRAINSNVAGPQSKATFSQYRPHVWWPSGEPDSPGAPGNLASTIVNDGVELTWDAPRREAWDTRGEVTGYQILRRSPELCEYGFRVYVDDTGNAEPRWIDKNFEPGTLYEYHVRAINDVGPGYLDRAFPTSIRPLRLAGGTEPNSPATGVPSITGTVQVGETLTADTSGIADSDGLSGARFYYQWLAGQDTEIQGATSATYTPVSVDEGKTIKVRVKFTDDALYQEVLTSSATTEVAAGSESTQVEETPPEDSSAPRAPHALWSRWSVRGEPEGIVLHWRAPSGPVTGYQILRSEDPALSRGTWGYGCTTQMVVHVNDTGSDATTYTDSDVAEGVIYTYRVKAINSNGVGPQSHSTRQQYRPHGWWPSGVPGSPQSPRNLEGAQVNDGTELQGIELTWDAPDGEVTGYQILRRLPEECEYGYRVYVENTNSSDTSWSDTNVEVGTLYQYHVRAINDVGAGKLKRSNSASVRPRKTVIIITMGSSGPEFPPGYSNDFTIGVDHLQRDDDPDTVDYTLRGDVTLDTDGSDADACEGDGLGEDLEFTVIDEVSEYFQAIFGGPGCNAGTYTLTFVLTDRDGQEVGTFELELEVGESPEEAVSLPTISGTAQVGETLAVDTSLISDDDGLDNATFSYQWIANDGTTDTDIAGATSSTYLLVSADAGKSIKVRVSFTDDQGNEEALTSAATVAVVETVPGRPRSVEVERGGTGELDVSWEEPDSNGGSAITGYTIQWKEASYSWDMAEEVSEANTTDTSYTIASLSLGLEYSVRVIATNSAGDSPASEEATATPDAQTSEQRAATENSPATGAPTISGTLEVGQTLYADTSNIADEDGLANPIFSYQWLADDSEIAEATDSTYTLTDSDEGKAISVRASFTDDAANEETLTSTPVDPSRPYGLNAAASDGAVVLTWNRPVGQSFLYDYQILRNRPELGEAEPLVHVEYTGTEETTYTDTDVEPRVLYVYRVKAADFFGTLGEASEPVEIRVPAPAPGENKPATGAPAITGTAQVGETLTADTSGIADSDGLDNATFSYQWLADYTEIEGATGSTYTLTDSDEGNAISVRVSFTDDGGNEETLTSAATAPVDAAPSPNSPATGKPTITGTAQVGETLTADTSGIADSDGLDNARFSYQWLADDTEIEGATGSNYTLTDSEEGKTIKVRVSFTDDGGNKETLTSAATASVDAAPSPNSPATGKPTITGTAQVGETLTADTSGIEDDDGLDNVSYTYQWLSDDTEIAEATGSTYTLTDSGEGKTIKVRVSFTDDGGNDETLTSAATTAVEANLTAELQGVPDSHDGSEKFTFRILFSEPVTAGFAALKEHSFEVSNATIKRAQRVDGRDDLRKFTVEPSSDGAVVLVLPTAEDCADEGAICTSDGKRLSTRLEIIVPGPANTAATGAPTISGTSEVGQTLTASTSGISDADGLSNVSFSYQWIASDGTTDRDIQGATASTYTLADADIGKAIKVRLSFTDDRGTHETVSSAATESVAAAPPQNSPATGAPSITGTAQVGETLTADSSGIADADGLTNATFTYQWLSDDTDISGATGSSYTLTGSEEGQAIKVRVSFTDDAGNHETLTSPATDVVEEATQPNTPATGAPMIEGTPQAGETLSADTSAIADSDGLENAVFTYQWLADDADIAGETNSTYDLADADVGRTIKVRVTFTDDANNRETLTSEATAAVAARPNSPATGAPSISGTAQAGETLAAGTSGIADADGLTSVEYGYQWLADDADIQGAASSTYTLTDDQVGKTIKVKVTFTDDANNQETLTSAATGTVAAAPVPLTVSLEDKPTSHDGTNDFSFDIRFSEEFDLSYKTLRDHAFNVSGGSVQKAERLQKEPESNIGWRITVRLDGNGDVTVVLPVTTDCSAVGAICTGDGRMLSNRLEFTVSGPGG